MPDQAKRYYWDSNVLLSDVNRIPDRLSAIEGMLDDAERGKIEIVTSMVTIAEVAYAATEKLGHALDAATEADLDALWEPPIRLIEFQVHQRRRHRRQLHREALREHEDE